jgi:hypothetical protein
MRSLPALLVLLYLASALTPCPEPRSRPGAPGTFAAHAIGRARLATSASGAASRGGIDADGWCRHREPRLNLVAVCPCGCGDRPQALGSPIGVGWALLTAPAEPARPGVLPRHGGVAARAPVGPPRAIDHVPLASA